MIQVSKIAHHLGHKGPVYTLENGIEPNSFLSAGADGVLVQWTLGSKDGIALASFPDAVFVLKKLVFSDGGILLLAGCKNGMLYFFDLKSNTLLKAIQHHDSSVFSITQNKDFIYTGDGSGKICKWNSSMELVAEKQIALKSIRSLIIINNGNDIAAACSNHDIFILDLNLNLVETLKGHSSSVFSSAYNQTKEILYSVGRDAQLIKWNRGDGQEALKINAHLYPIHHLSICPNEKFLATGSMDKSIRIWDSETLQLLKVIDFEKRQAHTSSVNQVLWMNNNTLVSCSDDRSVQVFKIEEVDF